MSGISEKELEGLVNELIGNAKEIRSRTEKSYKEEWPTHYRQIYANDIGIADGQELVARLLAKRYKIKSREHLLNTPMAVKQYEKDELDLERLKA